MKTHFVDWEMFWFLVQKYRNESFFSVTDYSHDDYEYYDLTKWLLILSKYVMESMLIHSSAFPQPTFEFVEFVQKLEPQNFLT